MSEIVIKSLGLGKKYKLGMSVRHDTLRDQVMHAAKRIVSGLFGKNGQKSISTDLANRLLQDASKPLKEFWALKNVSFDIRRGEVVGIIGPNGAGKSTLLKILSQITAPSEGEIRLRGRVASLLEVGTGMHPELSGRENVYLNGAILGMRKSEIDTKYSKIVKFAGISEFMSTPIKRYSSGMRVRLGFAIAAHLDPQILIIDEVLSVGDLEFQRKCLDRMHTVAEGGRTVLFVSHNMAAVKSLCTRSLLLNEGRCIEDGETSTVVQHYLAIGGSDANGMNLELITNRTGNQTVSLSRFHIEDTSGRFVDTVSSGDDVNLVFQLRVNHSDIKKVDVGFRLHDAFGACLSVLYSSFQGRYWTFKKPGYYFVRCKLKNFAFAPGRISVKGRVLVDNLEADSLHLPIGVINIVDGDFYGTGRSSQCGGASLLLTGSWD